MSSGFYGFVRFGLLLFYTCLPAALLPGALRAEPADELLRRRQRQIQQVCRDVVDAVVSVKGASGVIISEDGIVLSQYHVSHERPGGPYANSYPPGQKVPVVFHDGREGEGELLGADRECDLSLLKLVKPGRYPFVPVDADAAVDVDDWVLKFGHPGGYEKGRKPVVRLGRVVCRIETERLSEFISDCCANRGDSGGPYFDLEGRLVGIIRSGTNPPGVALPKRMVLRTPMVAGTRTPWLFAATSIDRIHAKLELMRRGEMTPAPPARNFPEIYRDAKTLDVDHWKHGRESLREFESAVANARQSIVRIMDGNDQAALGTVVSVNGVIVTKASVLPENPRCVTHDGREISVSVVGMAPAFDVVVLRTDAEITPVRWAEDLDPPVGSFQISPGPDSDSLAVGIVSVARRDLSGPFPQAVVRHVRPRADPPEIEGIPVEGRGLIVVSVDGKAGLSGLEPADELIRLGTVKIRSETDLVAAIASHSAGDTVSATVLRDGELVQLAIELENRRSPIETRGFTAPTIIEHDAPVNSGEYGGPILNLDGHATGITVATAGEYGCFAIPGGVVRRIVFEQSQE